MLPMFSLTGWGGERTSTGSVIPEDMHLPPKFVETVIFVGVVLRLWQYLLNRSLWADEACLALNIIHRQYSGLLQPLDYHQAAPIGFLFLEKLLVEHWGADEYVLRLLPLLAGFASLFMFYGVARRAISRGAVPIALVLFAISPPLIYYSSELKQYSSDVAIALLLYLLALTAPPSRWNNLRIAALGLIGLTAIWFSHPALFVLAGIGAVFTVILVAERRWTQLARFGVAYAFVLGSMAVCYFAFLRNLARDNDLLDYWASNFMPVPPKSVSDLKWFYDNFFKFFSNPIGLSFTGLAALAFIVGGFHLYSRDRVRFWLLLLPSIFTLLASSLHKYPFGGRLVLFLAPSALLLIGEGAEQVRVVTRRETAVVGYLLVGLLFVDPAVYLLHHFAKPHVFVTAPGIVLPEEIKPVLGYVRGHQSPTDLIYIFRDAQSAYEYYDDLTHLHDHNLRLGMAADKNSSNYVADLDRLRGRRVWVVFSHINGVEADAPKYVCFYLDTIGKQLDVFSSPGAVAYLYDLTGK